VPFHGSDGDDSEASVDELGYYFIQFKVLKHSK
jgi:hypothetical protein